MTEVLNVLLWGMAAMSAAVAVRLLRSRPQTTQASQAPPARRALARNVSIDAEAYDRARVHVSEAAAILEDLAGCIAAASRYGCPQCHCAVAPTNALSVLFVDDAAPFTVERYRIVCAACVAFAAVSE